MPTTSLRRAMADEPFARWLVSYAESRGWRTGRQTAKYLRINQAVLGTWLRGEVLPSPENQERLAEATGEPLGAIEAVVRETRLLKTGHVPARYEAPGRRDGPPESAIGTPDAAEATRLGVAVALAYATGDLSPDEVAYLRDFADAALRRARRGRAHGAGGREGAGDPG